MYFFDLYCSENLYCPATCTSCCACWYLSLKMLTSGCVECYLAVSFSWCMYCSCVSLYFCICTAVWMYCCTAGGPVQCGRRCAGVRTALPDRAPAPAAAQGVHAVLDMVLHPHACCLLPEMMNAVCMPHAPCTPLSCTPHRPLTPGCQGRWPWRWLSSFPYPFFSVCALFPMNHQLGCPSCPL